MARSSFGDEYGELLAFGGAVAAARLVTVDSGRVRVAGRFGLPDVCVVRRVTGHRCPMCGMTRSFALITRGRLRDAIRSNPVSPFVFGFFVARAAGAARRLIRHRVTPGEGNATGHGAAD